MLKFFFCRKQLPINPSHPVLLAKYSIHFEFKGLVTTWLRCFITKSGLRVRNHQIGPWSNHLFIHQVASVPGIHGEFFFHVISNHVKPRPEIGNYCVWHMKESLFEDWVLKFNSRSIFLRLSCLKFPKRRLPIGLCKDCGFVSYNIKIIKSENKLEWASKRFSIRVWNH